MWAFVLFGALMMVDIAVFAAMAAHYTPYALKPSHTPEHSPGIAIE